MGPLQWVGLELKQLLRNRFATLAAGVIVLIPLLYSFLYLYAFWDPYAHLENLRVAVVNQDVSAAKDEQTLNAGSDLVDQLKSDNSVGWVFTNQQDAFNGLNNSKYDLVLLIPKNFSQTILDTTASPQPGQTDPKAKLQYYSNPSKNYLAEQIGEKVALKVQDDLNGRIAGDFLDNVFGNLNDLDKNLQTAADGSGQLQTGISQASNGSRQLTDRLSDAVAGITSLSQGMKAISAGSVQFSQGSLVLASGSQALQDGSKTVQNGVDTTLAASKKLADGSTDFVKGLTDADQSLQDAAAGSARLYSGLSSAAKSSEQLQGGLAGALNGSSQLKNGADQLYSALASMSRKLNSADSDPASAGIPTLIQGADALSAATAEPAATAKPGTDTSTNTGTNSSTNADTNANPETITGGVKAAGEGIGQVADGLNSAAPALAAADNALSDAKGSLDLVLKSNPSLHSNPDFMKAYQEVSQTEQGLQTQASGLAGAVTNLNTIQQGLTGQSTDPLHPSVLDGLKNLNQGSGQLKNGLQTLLMESNSGLKQMMTGASALSSGSANLNNGLTSAAVGSSSLTQGLNDLTAGSAQLSSGLVSGQASFSQLVDGGKTYQDGLNQLNQGLGVLDQGLGTFAQKVRAFVQGAVGLSDGAKSLNAGVSQLTGGSATLQAGLISLQNGSSALTDGLNKTNNGIKDLTSGLQDGVNKLQTKLPQNAAVVSKTMGEPVEADETQVHPVANYGTGFAPYFIPLSLWVGALMLFFLINLKENTLWAAGVPKSRILLGKYAALALFGVAQALITSFVIITFLGLRPGNVLEFYAFNVLQSLAYVSIIFLLVGLFDMAGRFIAIVLLMLQLTSGGGTYPVSLIPKFFQTLHPYLPMTYGISALRAIISGSADISLYTSVLFLAGVGLGAILLALLLAPKHLRIKDLHPSPQLGA